MAALRNFLAQRPRPDRARRDHRAQHRQHPRDRRAACVVAFGEPRDEAFDARCEAGRQRFRPAPGVGAVGCDRAAALGRGEVSFREIVGDVRGDGGGAAVAGEAAVEARGGFGECSRSRLGDQGVLAGEVFVEAAVRQAGGGADVSDARRLDAAAPQQRGGLID